MHTSAFSLLIDIVDGLCSFIIRGIDFTLVDRNRELKLAIRMESHHKFLRRKGLQLIVWKIYVANGHYSSQRKPCCPWPPPRCRTGVSTVFHANQENEQDNRSGFILTFSLCGHTYVHAEDWKGWTSHNKENHCYGNYFQIRRVTILLLNVMNNSERIYLEFLCVPTICGVPAKLELNAWQHLRNSMNSPAHQLFPDNEEQCESVVRKPTFSKCVKLTEQSTLFSKEAAHFNPQKDKLQTFKNIALGDSSTKT
ncbi:hypothetical protein T4D_657 [Trichinella pseudospiralis]|uniref:Uncharacterized protein n=1 Tax=Trichinella pseudospiralis TaxID=6337 RepID=A0A0V1G573_TRIPS|nr:hypothetical protein T4D_657 [Trichinella pseudospiralis]